MSDSYKQLLKRILKEDISYNVFCKEIQSLVYEELDSVESPGDGIENYAQYLLYQDLPSSKIKYILWAYEYIGGFSKEDEELFVYDLTGISHKKDHPNVLKAYNNFLDSGVFDKEIEKMFQNFQSDYYLLPIIFSSENIINYIFDQKIFDKIDNFLTGASSIGNFILNSQMLKSETAFQKLHSMKKLEKYLKFADYDEDSELLPRVIQICIDRKIKDNDVLQYIINAVDSSYISPNTTANFFILLFHANHFDIIEKIIDRYRGVFEDIYNNSFKIDKNILDEFKKSYDKYKSI